jgi:hypothetical protein
MVGVGHARSCVGEHKTAYIGTPQQLESPVARHTRGHDLGTHMHFWAKQTALPSRATAIVSLKCSPSNSRTVLSGPDGCAGCGGCGGC